jgi:VirE-like protein
MSPAVTISMVLNALATDTRDVSAEAIIHALRDGRWQKPIELIRSVYRETLKKTGDRKAAKLAVDADKKQLPGILWSGRFSRRANTGLIQHSGLLCADLDSLGEKILRTRVKLLSSQHLWALFFSPTRDGLKAIFRVHPDASKHLASFHAVEKHVLDLIGIQIDQARKDLAGLCFVSYDPDAYYNPNAVEIQPLPEPVKLKLKRHNAGENTKPDRAQIREMLAVIPKRPDYPEWIKVVAAVGDALPDDEAIESLNEWSPEERPSEYADKLRHRLSEIHIGTLIHLAREHGWTGNFREPQGKTPRVEVQRSINANDERY